MIESLEELVDVFQLDNRNNNTSSLEGDTLQHVPPPVPEAHPLPLKLSSIDWKYAYEELYDVITEALRQLKNEEESKNNIKTKESALVNSLPLNTQQSDQPPIKTVEDKTKVKKVESDLAGMLQNSEYGSN